MISIHAFNTSAYSVGFYNYTLYANDTDTNWAVPVTGNFTILQATSEIQLFLNGTRNNTSVDEDTLFNITAILTTPTLDEFIQIFKNGTLIANSSSPAVNISAHQPGLYNITAVYVGNENYTGARESWWLLVNDTTAPNVSVLTPAGETFNQSDAILVSANVSDNVLVDTVLANVSWNGTYDVLSLTSNNGVLFNTTFSMTSWIGNYSVGFFANDTSSNVNNTETTWFVVRDSTRPIINDFNATPQVVNFSQNITIFANVTDNVLVDTVLVEIFGVNYSMSGPPGDIYTYTFNTSVFPVGFYEYIIYANDSENNFAVSVTGNFTILKSPSDIELLLNNVATNISINQSETVNATTFLLTPASSPDLIQLYIDGLLVANSSSPAINISSFTQVGLYNVTAIFTGNVNYTGSSITRFFTVNDSESPVINSHNATPNSTTYGENITIFANVTDNVAVAGVLVEIEGQNYSLSAVGGLDDVYSYEFNTSIYTAGTYSYTIYGNDTRDNWAASVTGNFTIEKAASVLELYLNDTQNNITHPSTQQLNTTALLVKPLTSQFIQIYKNGSLIANSSSPAVNISLHAVGVYNITAIYLGNENYTASQVSWELTINDTAIPIINSHNATPEIAVYGENITIFANVTDNVAVAGVLVEINGQNFSLTPVSGLDNIYSYLFNTSNYAVGIYNYTVYANDTNTNWATAALGNFTITKATSSIALYLDGVRGNQSVLEDNLVNITAILTKPEASTDLIQIYRGATLIANSSSVAENISVYPDPATYFITAIFTGNENYTASNETWELQINDTTAPSVIDILPNETTRNYEQTQIVTVQANVTDNGVLTSVFANISWNNSNNHQLIELLPQGAGIHRRNFGTTEWIGIYNVTFIATDSFGNVNATETTWFNVSPIPKFVFWTAPLLDVGIGNISQGDLTGIINISAVHNHTNVSVICASGNCSQISHNWSNGDYLNDTADRSILFTCANQTVGSFAAYFNLTSNEDVTPAELEVRCQFLDDISPKLLVVSPLPITIINETDSVLISANVTDNVLVATVFANVSWNNNNSNELVELLLTTGDLYNFTFTNTTWIGNYSVDFFANDTSGNVNNTERTWFVVRDSTSPAINDFNATPNSTAYGANITIFANVTDNVQVSEVSVLIDGQNYSLSAVSGLDDVYFFTFNTSVYTAGFYTYTLYANDSESNWAVPVIGNFTIEKATSNLSLYIDNLRNDTTTGSEETVNITAILSRPLLGEFIQMYKNGSLIVNSSSPAVNVSVHEVGYYNITTVYLGNENYTASQETYFLTILDTTVPVINSHNVTPNSTAYGTNITIFANVTDNVAVDGVLVEIENQNYSLSEFIGQNDTYSFMFNTSDYAVGTYTYSLWANDTSGNNASKQEGNFTITKATSQLALYLNGTLNNACKYYCCLVSTTSW